MEAALASGDVDAVRRLLTGGKSVPPPLSASNNLFHGRHWLKLQLAGGLAVELLQYRVMGKVVWPAAHALAELLLESASEKAPEERCAAFVEVAAGAGLPSLVAASSTCGGAFGRVVATDFTEEQVQLLDANDERNGRRIAATATLDLTSEDAPAELARLTPDAGAVVLAACDLAYNDAAVVCLFAVAAAWWRDRGGGGGAAGEATAPCRLSVLFSRSSNFEHTDEATLAAAAAHGFALARRETRRGVPGVLDSSSAVTFVGCQDDVAEILTFVPSGTRAAETRRPV